MKKIKKVRILYISNTIIPSFTANSIQVMKMCQAIAQSGFEIELWLPKSKVMSELNNIDLWHHYGIQTQFKIRRIFFSYGKVAPYFFAPFVTLPIIFSKADIIYTRDLRVAVMAIVSGKPIICELHQMPSGRFGPSYLRLFTHKKALRYLVVISEALKKDLEVTYPKLVESQQIIVAHDGVDLERFKDLPDPRTARQRLNLRNKGFVAGYAGHFYPGKGMEIILELAKKCPELNFMIMGGKPDAIATLKRDLKRMGVNNILVQGFIPNLELPLYLAACDVLLLPLQRKVLGSGGDDIARWTSPMKLFEYMASGRLIIASDLPVLREVLNGSNALLCNSENLEEWRQGLKKAELDLAWRQSLAQKAREDVRKYSWAKRVDRCLQPILQVLSGAIS